MVHKRKVNSTDPSRYLKRICTTLESLLRQRLDVPRDTPLAVEYPVPEDHATDLLKAVASVSSIETTVLHCPVTGFTIVPARWTGGDKGPDDQSGPAPAGYQP